MRRAIEPRAAVGARRGAVFALAAAALTAAGSAAGAPPRSLPEIAVSLAAVERAAVAARRGDPEAVQRRYELARSLADELAAVRPGSRCRFYDAVGRTLHGHVLAAEGFDRSADAIEARGEREVAAGRAQLTAAVRSCPPGPTPEPPTPSPLRAPRAGEAFSGEVRATLPRGTSRLELHWRGKLILRVAKPPHRAWVGRLPPGTAFGRGTLELTARTRTGTTTMSAAGVWHLPRNGLGPIRGERPDARLAARLEGLAGGLSGIAGIWVHDLRSGRTAGWNEGARFPAASTVKLGVLAASLQRYGPRPERTPLFHELQALAGWSSNLAANRLLGLLGGGSAAAGRRVVERELVWMGATESTYPGSYRVGTAHVARPSAPPLGSRRTTTARDLGRVLTMLQAAASGSRSARAASRLSEHEARVGLALLLDTEPVGDNVGLFRPWLARTVPAAQKHGWIASARHTAAIVYAPGGPVVVVLLTYGSDLTLRRAQLFGREVVTAALH